MARNIGISVGEVPVSAAAPFPVTGASGGSGGALEASEAHIGEATNPAAVVTPTITVSTSPQYSAGDSIGGKITLANAVRISGGISLLQSIMMLDRANQKPVGTILIFNADPSAATLTDNAAFVFSTDDLKVVAAIPVLLSDWVTINSKTVANLRNIGAVVKAASGTSLYAGFVTTSTPTEAATTDIQMAFGFININ